MTVPRHPSIVFALIFFCISIFFPFQVRAKPVIGSVSPGTATANVAVTLSASVSASDSSIATCNLYIDSDDKGAMTVSGGVANKSYVFSAAQIYTVFVFCRDAAGGFSSGPNSSIWAKAPAGGGDVAPPAIGTVSPATAMVGASVTLSASVSDAGGVASCRLFVSGTDQGAMTVSGNAASRSHTFAAAGTYTVYAQCTDNANNTGSGTNTAVAVSAAPLPSPTPTSTPIESAPPAISDVLIKLECPAEAVAVDHPCKAVYYVGKDGKRHAFPNEKVYFTWYPNFDSVLTVTADSMADYALGKNVTYRPGVRMVKFTTVSAVYSVAKGGVLRWVKTEADAVALYGADWNKKIDDISDAMFNSYAYGSDITPQDPYNLTAEFDGAKIIDDSL